MKDKKWYAGDLHQHSVYSSALFGGDDDAPDTLLEIYSHMRLKGLSFGAVSDHHNILNHQEWQKFASLDFIPIISKEISTGQGHIMALNTPEDVIFSNNVVGDEDIRLEFIRICQEIKGLNGIAQINHPREHKSSLAFPKQFTDLLPIFDTMEIWNGSETMTSGTKNGDAFDLWISLLNKGIYIPATTGSDCHKIKESKPERNIKTYVLIEELNLNNILEALKRGNSFLTSEPFVDIKINNKSYGETATHNGEITIDIFIESTKKVDKLIIIDNNKPNEISINSMKYQNKLTYKVDNISWLVFVVGTNTYNKAITNPIFLQKL